MTPPAAATARRAAAAHPARPRPRRVPNAPRRVSGPAAGRRAARSAVAAPRPVALRLAAAVHAVAEHRFLDRIIRGRTWIAVVGVGLIGIVFMQVSMLRMNAGVGRAVEQASTLERQNAALQASVSQLSSGDRIEAVAGRMGLVLPPGGSVRFLDARGVSLRKAMAGIAPPGSRPLEPLVPTTSAPLQIAQTGVAPGPTGTGTTPPASSAPADTSTPATAPAATTTPAAPAAAAPAQPTAAPAQPAAAPTQQRTATPVAASGGTSAGQGG